MSNITLAPARAKAHSPYLAAQGDTFTFRRVVVAGGTKGTGKAICQYGYFLNTTISHPTTRPAITTYTLETRSRMPTTAEAIRQKLSECATIHGYTITHWPKELRP